ncbi:uncharacterized protein LOC132176177 [Corylus avellana]|uniref:uncharacterized protein LOC132176177 n=1 Tax=Corylus avellana TaxID=13451 RepID=UPI00286D0A37|nr:uncharacterized protein LOC132176177 [Corylus avellana]
MGIWGFLCSIGDSLKGWCSSARGYGSAAVTEINNGRIKATQKLSDKKTRAKIAPIAVDLAKNAAIYSCQEGLKSIPGGTLISEIIWRSIRGEKKCECNEGVMKALQTMVAKMEEIIKKWVGRTRKNPKWIR